MFRWLGLIGILLAIGGCDSKESAGGTNPLGTRSPMAHKLVEITDFTNAEFKNTKVEPAGVVVEPGKSFPSVGTWTSRPIETEFAFTELLPSWNITMPAMRAGVRFDVRVRDAKAKSWSPWLYIGYWGERSSRPRVIEFDGGKVEVDVLVLKKPADAFEIRATLTSFDPTGQSSPVLRKLTAVYSRPVRNEAERVALVGSTSVPDNWARDLGLKFRPQGVEAPSIKGEICSPTSTSMVMAHFGVDRPTQENALAIYDVEYDLFGNWNRAVARAGELGLEAWLERFSSMDEVKARIAAGQPVIASIRFPSGTFPSNVMDSTDGHLIVIRGFTPEGDVIVNDPASKDRGDGVVYKADELARAWFQNAGGVAYLIRSPGGGVSMSTR